MNYYTLYEVSLHDNENDVWVSLLGKVYNLTRWVEINKGTKLIEPLLTFAGKDLSHWFNADTEQVNSCIDPKTGKHRTWCPHGVFYDENSEPWWTSDEYLIGHLTKISRPIRIINMLTGDENILETCYEHTLNDIMLKYSFYNSNWPNYTPVYRNNILDLDKTLDENDIPDDRDWLIDSGLPDTSYIPAIEMYYNDSFNNQIC